MPRALSLAQAGVSYQEDKVVDYEADEGSVNLQPIPGVRKDQTLHRHGCQRQVSGCPEDVKQVPLVLPVTLSDVERRFRFCE